MQALETSGSPMRKAMSTSPRSVCCGIASRHRPPTLEEVAEILEIHRSRSRIHRLRALEATRHHRRSSRIRSRSHISVREPSGARESPHGRRPRIRALADAVEDFQKPSGREVERDDSDCSRRPTRIEHEKREKHENSRAGVSGSSKKKKVKKAPWEKDES